MPQAFLDAAWDRAYDLWGPHQDTGIRTGGLPLGVITPRYQIR